MVLNKRYKRNIKSNLSFYISVIVLTAVCVMVYLTMACGLQGMEAYIDEFKDEYVMEDAQFTTYRAMDDSAMDEFEEKYDLLIEKQAYIDIDGQDEDTIRLFHNTDKINKYKVTEGEDIASDDDILLSASYMDSNAIQIGDKFELDGREYNVCGKYDRPDYLYILDEIRGSFATPETFGIAMVSDAEYDRIYETLSNDEVTYYSVKYNESDVEAFRKDLNDEFMVSGYVNKDNNNRISTADSTLDMTRDIKDVIIPIIFVFVIVIVAAVLGRKVKSEQKMIGILSALGYSKSRLALHYSFFGSAASILGSIFGIILAVPMENVLIPMAFVKLEDFPVEYGLSASNVAVALIVPFIAYTAAVFLTALVILRKETIDMINGTSEKKENTRFRMAGSKLRFSSKFKIRSILGKPVRTLIIIIGICFGSLIFLYTYGVVDSLGVYVNESIDKIGDLEYQYYLSEIKTDEPEEGTPVTYASFECGDDDSAVTVMGMENNSLMNTELISGGDADLDGGGYYITNMGATVFDVKEGDTLTLKNIASLEENSIEIAGIVDNDSQNIIFTSSENVCDILDLPEGSYNLVISDQSIDYSDSELAQTITKSSLRNQIKTVYDLVKSEVGIMIPFGIVICVFVIYIMANMIISEHSSAISMFKILGYKDREINRIVINVYNFVIPVAAILGLVAGYIFIKSYFIANAEAFNSYAEAHFSVATVIKYFVLVFLSYGVSLVILGNKVRRINMAEGLKDNRE